MSENTNPEESEDAISQYLQDLGMLEDGMTPDDKRSLWTVVKISQDTAKAEERDRQQRARRTLQLDQVSSRTELSSGSGNVPVVIVEDVMWCSDHEREGKVIEEEKEHTIAAILPQQCATSSVSVAPSQCTTATVPPFLRSCESDVCEEQNTVNSGSAPMSPCEKSPSVSVSQNQQVDSASEDSNSPIRHVAKPSARRFLKASPNVEMNETRKLSPKNNSPGLNSSSSPFSRLFDKEQHKGQTVPETEHVAGSLKSETSLMDSVMTSIEVPRITRSSPKSAEHCDRDSTSSSPLTVAESSYCDQGDLDSPMSTLQESSLVTRIQHSLSMSNCHKNKTRAVISDKSDVNDDCCEENNFNALKEDTENLDLEKSVSASGAVDNVPSLLSYSLLNEATSITNGDSNKETEIKKMEDQERNIKAFNCDRSNYEWTFKVRKVKRACSRLPFYIPPCKMDVHTYILYFKRCIKEQASRLIEAQRKNHKCVPWGEPVVVGESNSNLLVNKEPGEQNSKSLANLQRYNLQDRKVAYQRVDSTYEDPDALSDDDIFLTNTMRRNVTVESQQDTGDDLFDALLEGNTKDDDEGSVRRDADNTHNEYTSVERQGSVKRKSDSSDDQTFDQEEKDSEPQEKRAAASPWLTAKKEEAPSVAVKRKTFCQVTSYAESAYNYNDLDGDFEPSKKVMRQRHGVKSYMKKRNWKKTSYQSQSLKKEDGDVDDETSIFDDLDNAEGVGGDPDLCQETEIIRPGPIKLGKQGHRRLFHHSQVEVEINEETEHKESEAVKMGDMTVVYDVGSTGDMDLNSELVPCPICRKTFPAKDIEAHASECNEYCEEEIPADELHISESSVSPEMFLQNTQGAISEQCWRDFESGKRFEGDHSARYQTRQQRPKTRQGTAASKHT